MKYIAYYRVSTQKQGSTGLGLEAQRTAVKQFITSRGGIEVPPSYTEVESGKKNDRPELRKAINQCKDTGATLLIASLDRLSRNVAFIFDLKAELESGGVDFIACDLPEANTLTLGVMSAMAQHGRELTSKRTKAGLAEAKKRGVILGTPENLTEEARAKAHRTISEKAYSNLQNRHAFHFIKPLKEEGVSYQKIADRLNSEGYRTRKGKEFHASQVHRIYARYTKE